jgi:hypothetical protein
MTSLIIELGGYMKQNLMLAGAVLVVVVIFVLLQLMLFVRLDKMIVLMQKDTAVISSDDLLRDKVDVIIGDFTVVKNKYEYGNESKLDVVIINKASEKASYQVTIEAADANGNRITEWTVSVDLLKPNQRQTQQAFTYVSEEVFEKLKTASFNVLLVKETTSNCNYYNDY